MHESNKYLDVFTQCATDAKLGIQTRRSSFSEKEFHFQNWFIDRLVTCRLHFETGGRNKYPDFSLVQSPEGFELKGLAFPGRTKGFDCNSQMPFGQHNGRDIYYVFGRYPGKTKELELPVIDLIICHGSFLNSDDNYIHENKHVEFFGSYGDIMIRDRKMYVAPTPFALTTGTISQRTLIIPASFEVDDRFVEVGQLIRTESAEVVTAYHFNLQTNAITSTTIPNPRAGIQHEFKAYRLKDDNPGVKVSMSKKPVVLDEEDE